MIGIGYMLIDGGAVIIVFYMSNIMFILVDKFDIVMVMVFVGEMLGLKLLYMDVGSGV